MKVKKITQKEIKEFKIKHILVGDKSDNILGVKKRMGEKTAEKFVHNLDGYLEIDEELEKRYNFNKILIDLSELPEPIYEEIFEEYQKKQFNYSMNGIIDFCKKYRLRKIGEKLDKLHWKQNSTALY